MAREIALLTNPTSGKGAAPRTAAIALPRLSEAGFAVRNLVRPRRRRGPRPGPRRASGDGVEALVVCGGDGMVHLAVQELAGSGDRLGIIPAGTGNDVARYLGIPRYDPQRAADVVVGLPGPHHRPGPHRSDVLRHRAGRGLRLQGQRACQPR